MSELFEAVVRDSPLRCAGVTKGYDGKPVLSGISIELRPGSIVGLVGRNGAGKTTLIQILLGLLQPDSGSATVLGEAALAMTDASKSRLAYVPQQPESLLWMRVGSMLDFVGSLYPTWDRAYVERALVRAGIAPSRPLSKLSPGERQTVALIRALALRPELLVLDEPAAALDPVARRELLRELALRAGDCGTTVLFSTHIVSDLERVASDVLCLHGHRIVLAASTDDLKETHGILRMSAEAASLVPGALPGELSRRRREDGGVNIVLRRRAGAPWPAALGTVTGGGDDVEVPGLEDLIIELTS
jgi:ABC-2 type transport system ATP-binding protein